jgi:hypothetical protein
MQASELNRSLDKNCKILPATRKSVLHGVCIIGGRMHLCSEKYEKKWSDQIAQDRFRQQSQFCYLAQIGAWLAGLLVIVVTNAN